MLCHMMSEDEQPDPQPPHPPSVLPEAFFTKEDESDDLAFYAQPRLVQHIDDETIAELTAFYREALRPGARVLDLMSSWVSHLPPEVAFARVTGHGMNAEELRANPQLTDWFVHDLNADPRLPLEDASFDYVLCAVSIQYLTRPVEVFAEIARVLAPGGWCFIAFSHRMFPTKAISAWIGSGTETRIRLVGSYFKLAGGFEEPRYVNRSPRYGDPLYIVYAQRAVEGQGGQDGAESTAHPSTGSG
jgi:SAM-dependent methyltransferase